MADRNTIDVSDLLENLNIKGFWGETPVPKTRHELLEVKRRILEQTFSWFEKQFLVRALEESNWNITSAARQVGMKRPNFSALMRKYKISRNPAS
jgi:two-component system NtrC family response regulator